MRFKNSLRTASLAACLAAAPAAMAEESPAIEAMQDYLDFSEYHAGIILVEQIPAEEWKNILVIDTRSADQYDAEHIPGAINIDWRALLGQRNELPTDQTLLLYCNSGTLSAQAGFALRVSGMNNVKILQGGFNEWKAYNGERR